MEHMNSIDLFLTPAFQEFSRLQLDNGPVTSDVKKCFWCNSTPDVSWIRVMLSPRLDFLPSNVVYVCSKECLKSLYLAPRVNVKREFRFESAHYLNKYDGKCANLHGHSYILNVVFGLPIRDTGISLDFSILKEEVSGIVNLLDHQKVNDIIPFNPTAENMLIWMWNQLVIKQRTKGLESIQLYETVNCSARLTSKQMLQYFQRRLNGLAKNQK
jgi:6-pyruvoyltetrahydropterin/6-carboxytetrahydropterin synthase